MGAVIDALERQGALDGLRLRWIRSTLGEASLPLADAWQILHPRVDLQRFGPQGDPSAQDAAPPRSISHDPRCLWEHRARLPLYPSADGPPTLRAPDPLYHKRFYERVSLAPLIQELETETLDRLLREAEVGPPDVVEIAAPGTEAEALKGGVWTLSRGVWCLGIQVAFEPRLEAQPLFGEVDALARKRGFTLADLRLIRRPRWISGFGAPGPGAPVAANAIYLREPQPAQGTPLMREAGAVLRAAILADACGCGDLALRWLALARGPMEGDPHLISALVGVLEDLRSRPSKGIPPPPPPVVAAPGTWERPAGSPLDILDSPEAQALDGARIAHLTRLDLPLSGGSILEVGSGMSALSAFLLAQGEEVTLSDGRAAMADAIRARHPGARVLHLDLDAAPVEPESLYDNVFAYSVLQCVVDLPRALDVLSARTIGILVVEGMVSPADEDACWRLQEAVPSWTGSLTGRGSLPTRRAMARELCARFAFVYEPLEPPIHPEFPSDWGAAPRGISRAVLVASRRPLKSASLAPWSRDRR